MNWHGHVLRMNEERLPQKIVEYCYLEDEEEEEEKRKTSKFMDLGSNNWNERAGNYQYGMDRQGRKEKENKTFDTERCENIDTLYINK